MATPRLTQAVSAEIQQVLGSAGLPDDPRRFVELVQDAVRAVVLVRHAVGSNALTDLDVRELRAIGLSPRAEDDRLREATRSATAKMAAILADSLSVEEAADRMELHQSRLRQMLIDRTLFGIKLDGEWRIPAFQLSGKRQVRNLGRVLRATPPNVHPVELANWLLRANRALEIEDQSVTPLVWLEAGGDPGPLSAIASEL